MDQKTLKNPGKKSSESKKIPINKAPESSSAGAKNLKSDKTQAEKKQSKKLKMASHLKKKEEPYKEKYQQLKEEYLYLRAEFENYKRRTLEEKRQFRLYEAERFISDLVEEVLDDFERALLSFKDKPSLEVMDKGLEMIHAKWKLLLKKYAVSSLDPKGKLFDPSYQEALSYIENSKYPEGYVVETYKKAYKLHDKIIRPAQVVVAKGKESPS